MPKSPFRRPPASRTSAVGLLSFGEGTSLTHQDTETAWTEDINVSDPFLENIPFFHLGIIKISALMPNEDNFLQENVLIYLVTSTQDRPTLWQNILLQQEK